MSNPNYPEIGGVWPSTKISGGLSLKLSNGMYISMLPNSYAEEGSKKPTYKASMKLEDAISLGLVDARTIGGDALDTSVPF